MKRIVISVVGIAFVIAWAELGPGVSGLSLPASVPALTQMMIVVAIAAPVFVLYFDWRARLIRRLLAGDGLNHDLDRGRRHDPGGDSHEGPEEDLHDGVQLRDDDLNKAA